MTRQELIEILSKLDNDGNWDYVSFPDFQR